MQVPAKCFAFLDFPGGWTAVLSRRRRILQSNIQCVPSLISKDLLYFGGSWNLFVRILHGCFTGTVWENYNINWCQICNHGCNGIKPTSNDPHQSKARNVCISLWWRHNGRDSVSNHQPHDCVLNLYSDADQRKHQSSASLAFVRGIHWRPVNCPHKWPVTRKMFTFDDVIMSLWHATKMSQYESKACKNRAILE